MKKKFPTHWIVLGMSVTIVVATCIFIYSVVNFDAANQLGDAESELTGIPNKSEDATSKKTILKYRSPEEAVKALVQIPSVFQRTASLYSYLADIEDTELVDLLHRTERIDRSDVRSSIQTIVLRKVTAVNPNDALRWIADIPRVRRIPLLKSVFLEWSLKNFPEAVEGAETLTGSDRQTAFETILLTRNDLSRTVLLNAAQKLGLEDMALHQLSTNQAHNLLNDPASSWNLLINDDIDNMIQLDMFKRVASAWKEQAGFDVLLHASALFPDKSDRAALSDVVEAVVGTEIGHAFTYLRNISRTNRGELPCALAMVAARNDPVDAFKQIADWSDDPIHLQLQKTVSNTWAGTDPRAMLDNLELLPQVARVDAMEIAFIHLAYVSPEEAILFLDASKPFLRSEVHIAAIIAEQWSKVDPEAALEWSISYSESNNGVQAALVRRVLRSFVATNPQKALELSRDLVSTRIHVTQASFDVIWELTQLGKLDEAIAILPQLEEHPRYFAIDELGRALVRAGDPYTAIELGAEVPSLRAPLIGPVNYFNGIMREWAARYPQHLFESLQGINSLRLQSMAANILLELQETRPVLARESIETLREFLTEHPATENVHLLELQLQEDKGLINLDELVMPKDWTE